MRGEDAIKSLPQGVVPVVTGDVGGNVAWKDIVSDIDVVIHLAARVHMARESLADPLDEFMKVNTVGTKKLAEEAARAEVKKFIYMSSVKVNGETTRERPFFAEDTPLAKDSYGISKWEAEQAVRDICCNSGMSGIIIRPTLVYGPGVGGNFLRLMKWVKKGIPLPLSSVGNKRSLVYLGNLVDAVSVLVENSDVCDETFLISDGEDISTPDLIRMIAEAMGKKARLIRVNPWVLEKLGGLIGRREDVRRLTGSLCVDNTKICNVLRWKAPFTFREAIRETVKWYEQRQS